MKKKILLIVLILAATLAKAQLNPPGRFSCHFLWRPVHVTLSNNFVMEKNGRDYTPYYQSSLQETFRMEVTGEQLVMSAFETNDSLALKEYSGTFTMDTISAHRERYRLKRLQTRITRNNDAPSAWSYVMRGPSFPDPAVTYRNDPRKYGVAYYIVNEKLQVGDSMRIEFRQDDGTPLSTCFIKRIPSDLQPFLMTLTHDSSASRGELAFIQQQLTKNSRWVYENLFYTDWPGKGLDLNGARYWPSSKLAFYFRAPRGHAGDSTFQYRLHGGKYHNTGWQLSAGVILVPALQAGANYKLEVRYKDRPAQISAYTFYVPPYWYQTAWFRTIIAALLLLLLLSLFFRYRIIKGKREAGIQKLEIQALYAQLNPHFIFNALSSIQGLMNDMQLEKANRYLSGFASLLRNTIQLGNKEFIPLQTELKHLEHYLELEALRFNFQYAIQVDPSLDVQALETLPLLTQPAVENAVKHGVAGKGKDGKIILSVRKDGQDIVFLIEDNGPGFDPLSVPDRHGIQLMRDRLALFRKTARQGEIYMQINSSAGSTSVEVRFKNWLHHD